MKTPERNLRLRRIVILKIRLGRHRPALCTSLANRGNAAADIQPSLLLKQPEQVIAVRDFAGDDLFSALLVSHRKRYLHRLIKRVLFGKVDEFYVESFLLLSLHCHIGSPRFSVFVNRGILESKPSTLKR